MNPFWYISDNFHTARSKRIGASEISACIPNPEKPGESLAGYGNTAITLWQEKTGRKERDQAGLPAEMGNWNEPKNIELFLRGIDRALGLEYLQSRLEYELLKEHGTKPNPEKYQATPCKHNTQWYNDFAICHPDGIWVPPSSETQKIKAHGLKIDLSKPFLIEAKNASYWSAKRRNGSHHSGFDYELKTWQGIPLKFYVQIQYQLEALDVNVCYLPLLSDSANHHVWIIGRNRKWGRKLFELASRMKWHIDHDKPPKDLAISIDDVCTLYPTINDDFRLVTGEDGEKAVELARTYKHADEQAKLWDNRKKDAQSALSVYLADAKELRTNVDGEIVPVVKWVERKGSERIEALKTIKEEKPEVYKYLEKKGCLSVGEASRSVKVCFKEAAE